MKNTILNHVVVLVLCCFGFAHVSSDALDHRYKEGDPVPLNANKVGPFSNPKSFLCGGSTCLFIYAYCLYYYYARLDMSGFMQISFFFGYMACICYGFFLKLGMVGFRAALVFVRHIYEFIKCE